MTTTESLTTRIKAFDADLKRVIADHRALTRLLARATLEDAEPLETHYREHVVGLVDTLSRGRQHPDAFHSLRAVIGQIILVPDKGGTGLRVTFADRPPERRRKPKMVRGVWPDTTTPDISARATYFGMYCRMQEQGNARRGA